MQRQQPPQIAMQGPKKPRPRRALPYGNYAKTSFDDDPTEERTPPQDRLNIGRASIDAYGNLCIDDKKIGSMKNKQKTLNKFYKYVAKKSLRV